MSDGSPLPSFVTWKDASTIKSYSSSSRTYNVFSTDNNIAGLISPVIYPVKITILSSPVSGFSINSYTTTKTWNIGVSKNCVKYFVLTAAAPIGNITWRVNKPMVSRSGGIFDPYQA
jgi:hypothetical protein